MRIDTCFATPNGALAGLARKAGAAQTFTLGRSAPLPPSFAAMPSTPLAGLDAILTLQTQTDTSEERRRRSARRGHDLLDGLDRLKAALIMGRVSTRELQAISGRLAERAGASGDPRLDALIADIELRAAVELAKLAVAQAV